MTSISEFNKTVFSANSSEGKSIKHDIYSLGKGKPVLLIQELPGIGIETLALAKQFVNNGFKVYLPHLFGPIGKTSLLGNTARVFCMRKEFKIFEKQQASPIISWLRALCQQISTENNLSLIHI